VAAPGCKPRARLHPLGWTSGGSAFYLPWPLKILGTALATGNSVEEGTERVGLAPEQQQHDGDDDGAYDDAHGEVHSPREMPTWIRMTARTTMKSMVRRSMEWDEALDHLLHHDGEVQRERAKAQ
jgi:hypothetical protein